MIIAFAFLLVGQAYSSPKATQAALINFKVNDITTVLAVEEFGKSPVLVVLKGSEIIYSTQFGEDFKALNAGKEFVCVNSFLRFKTFNIKGLLSPVLLAVAAQPGGSDEHFEIQIIAEKEGKITSLNPEPIFLTIQDGIFLGYIGKKYGYGMIKWSFQWDAAHYEPHKYEISIYKWDQENMNFTLKKKFITERKFKKGCDALNHYGFPCRNFRDEVIRPTEDISTLGIESELLFPNTNDK